MVTCRHCSKPGHRTVELYWQCLVPVCEECYARFERIRTAVDNEMGPILRLSQSGRYQDALQAAQRLLDQNLPFDDFGWLRRQVLGIEASVHDDAREYEVALEKLREMKKLGSPNLSAFVQDEVALARGLEKLNRNEEALQELEGALRISSTPEHDLPSPLDIQAALVHYVRISQHLGREVPATHRALFIQNAERLQIPSDVWGKEPSLSLMILKAEEWLHHQSQRAVAGGKDYPPFGGAPRDPHDDTQ